MGSWSVVYCLEGDSPRDWVPRLLPLLLYWDPDSSRHIAQIALHLQQEIPCTNLRKALRSGDGSLSSTMEIILKQKNTDSETLSVKQDPAGVKRTYTWKICHEKASFFFIMSLRNVRSRKRIDKKGFCCNYSMPPLEVEDLHAILLCRCGNREVHQTVFEESYSLMFSAPTLDLTVEKRSKYCCVCCTMGAGT